MAKSPEPFAPMDLGNMRSLGVRSLDVTCRKCRHEASLNVDRWPDHVPVPAFATKMRCTKCGSRDVTVRPNWAERPGPPRPT